MRKESFLGCYLLCFFLLLCSFILGNAFSTGKNFSKLVLFKKYFPKSVVTRFFSVVEDKASSKSYLQIDLCGLVRKLGFGDVVRGSNGEICYLKDPQIEEYVEEDKALLIVGQGDSDWRRYYLFLFTGYLEKEKRFIWVKRFSWVGLSEDLEVGFWNGGDFLYFKYTSGWGTGLKTNRLCVFCVVKDRVVELVDIPIEGYFHGLPTKVDWKYRGKFSFSENCLQIVYEIDIFGPREQPYEFPDKIIRKVVFEIFPGGSVRFNPTLSDIGLKEIEALEGDDTFICNLSRKSKYM